MKSPVTFEKFPTIQEAVKNLLETYLQSEGYDEFYDMTKVLYSTKHEEIVHEMINQAEEINDRAMRDKCLCPECGSPLRDRSYLERYDCTNTACAISYNKEAC